MHLVLISDHDVTNSANRSWFHNILIYESNRAFSVIEDFESGMEVWTNSGESSCTTGAFVLGIPIEQRTGGGFVIQAGGDHSMGGRAMPYSRRSTPICAMMTSTVVLASLNLKRAVGRGGVYGCGGAGQGATTPNSQSIQG